MIPSNVNLDQVLEGLGQAQQKFLADAAQRQNLFGDVMGSNPAADARQFLMNLYSFDAAKIAEIQGQFLQKNLDLWTSLWLRSPDTPVAEPEKGDRRFDAPEWKEYPLFDTIRQAYLLSSKALLQAVATAKLDDQAKQEMSFFARHFLDAMSPANYALTNPEVLKLAVQTQGQSFASGLKNLSDDLKKGYISLSDETAFDVGGNLANTPGAVVYENELIQLIQYRPTTSQVHEIPLVLVPSVVNKFYILDLTPESSFVRYFVSQGYTVFIVSWRGASAQLDRLTWDDYVDKGVIKAIDAACEISGQKKVNALGYCVGGTLLACALSVLAAKGKVPVASMTMLIAMLDYADPGEIGVYLGRCFPARRMAALTKGGVVTGKELTRTFSSLRANDLVWSFVINNYLKGKLPYAFDLFYWNNDDSNLPGPMFSSYVRDCYVDNRLIDPGAMTVCGTPVDLARIDVPTYIFNASEDHLVPWKSGYESVNQVKGDIEFVLGGGGHITGPVNPFSKNKRNYWIGGKQGGSADEWLASARSMQGSWWPHYAAWLKPHSGAEVPAQKKLGSRTHPEIEAAPGRYVKERVQ